MKQTVSYIKFKIGNIPAILFGEPSDNLYLFLHGQGGNKEEASAIAEIACPAGWQVLGIDLPGHGERTDSDNFVPWTVVPELRWVFDNMKFKYKHIALRANSIGAWFGMLAFTDKPLVQALFVSPILDMELLIQNMMQWAGVTKERLQRDKIIPTDFGQTLSWKYLTWVQEHPITNWRHPTKILYAGQDNLTERHVVDTFISHFGGELTVMENGEHWFHTPEQLETVEKWMRNSLLT
ncbi:alpha/beta hydrolase [Faecalicatena contorta]|uniref:Uncharacterized protein n=1 Tax=Faecalicatena contorta TaxID=39482 RepID=A0A316A3M2_9FIRM|nr:alpha/beta hydrolase [Faecalicatena contorta]PWJ52122.1 hypothetical protein A8805_101293 [Faecalicatena contorta]SUQ12400.1 hypothetical protein SAMN05216529_101293 [Faecalicatena contorta]